ncbi:hypothetical protein BD410DRAFT_804762 [Rickenella mellea]|uniref:Uncharacterized protein n=1 Tax=Rickenella mellea TaxID=50990 RepID=A0A4Y7Q0W8_9AGAM|nr:hypothetical protein BD410DRAFT_804762 [Rickenella mellea]
MNQASGQAPPQRFPQGVLWSALTDAGLRLRPIGKGVPEKYHPLGVVKSPDPDNLPISTMLVWLFTVYEVVHRNEDMSQITRYTLKMISFNTRSIPSLSNFTICRSVAVSAYEGRRGDPDAPVWLQGGHFSIDAQVHPRTKVVKTLVAALKYGENADLSPSSLAFGLSNDIPPKLDLKLGIFPSTPPPPPTQREPERKRRGCRVRVIPQEDLPEPKWLFGQRPVKPVHLSSEN